MLLQELRANGAEAGYQAANQEERVVCAACSGAAQ